MLTEISFFEMEWIQVSTYCEKFVIALLNYLL
jgi:hypothetical protein